MKTEGNDFRALLSVLRDEDIIRVRRRLEKQSNARLVAILTDELEEREGIERAAARLVDEIGE